METFYKYYAGFSPAFVEDVLGLLGLEQDALIADPWNGSGTTTLVGRRLGFKTAGFDINPALVLIAKARLVNLDVLKSVDALCGELLKMHRTQIRTRDLAIEEPFRAWFTAESASELRAMACAIRRLLIDRRADDSESHFKEVGAVSQLAALFLVALFRTVRSYLGQYATTNPTWIRTAKSEREKLSVAPEHLRERFQDDLAGLVFNLRKSNGGEEEGEFDHEVKLDLGDSRSIPLRDATVDAVVTSPPYCTRIDYAVATLPELATLGYGRKSTELRRLRDAMIGTPTLTDEPLKVLDSWGSTCRNFLDRVKTHTSRASDTYYVRYFSQYFDSLQRSLEEMGRYLRDGANCAVVVQDSYYKEAHNDLPGVVVEMSRFLGWKLKERRDFEQRTTKAAINSRSRAYRKDFSATESLLVFNV